MELEDYTNLEMIGLNIKKMHKKIIILFLLVSLQSLAQINLDHQVIGSAGISVPFGNWDVAYTVGEPVITTTTKNNITLTQGFHQPDSSVRGANIDTVKIISPRCKGDAFGAAYLSYDIHDPLIDSVLFMATYNSQVVWDTSFTITQNINSSDTLFTGYVLPIGNYSVSLIVFDGQGNEIDSLGKDFTIYINNSDCDSVITYHGITPNGDSHNETWQIDGIDSKMKVKVTIFNRWGEIVWNTTGDESYDNDKVVFAGKRKGSNEDLPDGTYFYVVEIDEKICKDCKGWLEITR